MVAAKRQQAWAKDMARNCPIAGCSHVFPHGTQGWYGHVTRVDNHPNWHPETRDREERGRHFVNEFPTFFGGSLTPSRRLPVASRAPEATPGPPPVAAMLQPRFCPCCGQPWPAGLTPPTG